MKHWQDSAYRDLEINHLLNPCTHLVVEAEPVFALFLSCEDEVALALFRALHYRSFIGTDDAVINIERATRLHLEPELVSKFG